MQRAAVNFLDAVERSTIDLFDAEERAGQKLVHGNGLSEWDFARIFGECQASKSVSPAIACGHAPLDVDFLCTHGKHACADISGVTVNPDKRDG